MLFISRCRQCVAVCMQGSTVPGCLYIGVNKGRLFVCRCRQCQVVCLQVLLTGKSINFLRQVCRDLTSIDGRNQALTVDVKHGW